MKKIKEQKGEIIHFTFKKEAYNEDLINNNGIVKKEKDRIEKEIARRKKEKEKADKEREKKEKEKFVFNKKCYLFIIFLFRKKWKEKD